MVSSKQLQRWKASLPPDAKHRIKAFWKAGRQISGLPRMRPSYLIIGARKAGTTTLYDFLVKHSQVLPALEKEVHFFDSGYARGWSYYLAHFPTQIEAAILRKTGGQQVITGEASPHYLYHPLAPGRIRDLDPSIRLIVLLRDPVDRAYSDYWYGVAGGKYTPETNPFERAVIRQMETLSGRETDFMSNADAFESINHQSDLIGRGLYYYQLQHWVTVFPWSQIRIIDSREFSRAPAAVFSDVQEFLGLEHEALPTYPRSNSNSYPALAPEMRELLARYFRPHNEALFKLLGRGFSWS